MTKKRAVIGMSGGVDSSLAAYLLKEKGYDVVGLFMSNWQEDDENGICCAADDFMDVKSVCATLDIPYYVVNLQKEYKERVFQHFVDEYQNGRTPNPDVLCNKEIKFDAFYKEARKLGADIIATGHYADMRVVDGHNMLFRALDESKDQTYFLNQLKEEQLQDVEFPLSAITKNQVRAIAKEIGLSTYRKKDSTGICFIGERKFKEFLSKYIPMKNGYIKDKNGKILGEHNGVFYYTLGQRKGLGIGGDGEPWFVYEKDVKTNTLYVVQGEDKLLYNNAVISRNFNLINNIQRDGKIEVLARIRHRQPLQKATCYIDNDNSVKVVFDSMQRGIAEGQYVVLYQDKICLGGGVIDKKFNN